MRWIDADEQLGAVLADLEQGDTYFIDTEFESTKAGSRLSVIQISRGGELYLLDALKLRNWRGWGEVLCRPDCQWVLHAGLSDVQLMLQALNRPEPPKLFDTQIAWALSTAEASVSLSYLKYRLLGKRTMKTHQTDDWMRRPLPQSQLEYAADDIADLPPMYEMLAERIDDLERRSVLDHACREALWPKPVPAPKLQLASFRNAWQLQPKNQAALRFLIEWYNELDDEQRERAPGSKVLLAIASRLPKTPKDLGRIKGVPPSWGGRRAESLLRGLNRAAREADGSHFVHIEPQPYATFGELRLDAWLGQLRAQVCSSERIAPELAFPSRDMRRYKELMIEQQTPDALLDGLLGWKSEVLRGPTERFMQAHPAPDLDSLTSFGD